MQKEVQGVEDIQVKLKPILGIRPTTYVPALYGVALLLLLFLVLFLPGVRKFGSVIEFVTTPAASSVRVDGVRVATAPGTVFVAAGERRIEIVHPGFAPFRTTLNVRGRLVGSLFFPRRITVEAAMEPDNLGDYVDDVSVEFALWALNGEASAEYQFPPIARVVGRDLAAAALAGEPGDALWTRFLLNALPNLTSEALLSDLVAGQLSSAGFGVATPTAIQSAVVQLAAIADLVPPLPLQLESILADSRVALLKDSAWYRNMNTDVVPLQFTAEGASRVSIGAVGLDFVPVPGASGTLEGHPRAARGGNQDSLRTVGPFSIASHEVSIAAYSLFLDENPQWAPTNRAELVSAGLVDDDYLAEWDVVSQQPELPVTGISYYAATAFGQWVNNRFLPEYTVSLPSESEWNVLLATGELSDGVFSGDGDGPVAVGSAGGAVSGVQGVAGNVWEWLEDWYGEFSALYPDSPNGPAAQRVVRGGSWVTNRLTFDDMDRGSLPPNWCSPFVGFRLVLRY